MNGGLIKLNARWIVSPQIGGYTGARCGERSRFVLRALASGVKHLSKSVTARLEEHPDGKIFTSLPRSGQINAAQMLAGWGDGREAYDSPDAVAAPAGLTVQAGNTVLAGCPVLSRPSAPRPRNLVLILYQGRAGAPFSRRALPSLWGKLWMPGGPA